MNFYTHAPIGRGKFFYPSAMFTIWIYTTGAVTIHRYGTSDITSIAYSEGAKGGGHCLAARTYSRLWPSFESPYRYRLGVYFVDALRPAINGHSIKNDGRIQLFIVIPQIMAVLVLGLIVKHILN